MASLLHSTVNQCVQCVFVNVREYEYGMNTGAQRQVDYFGWSSVRWGQGPVAAAELVVMTDRLSGPHAGRGAAALTPCGRTMTLLGDKWRDERYLCLLGIPDLRICCSAALDTELRERKKSVSNPIDPPSFLTETCTRTDWSISLLINMSIGLILMSRVSRYDWFLTPFVSCHGNPSNLRKKIWLCSSKCVNNLYRFFGYDALEKYSYSRCWHLTPMKERWLTGCNLRRHE